MSSSTQFEEIVNKLRQLYKKLQPPLKHEVADMSHDITQHIYEKVRENDKKHGCYNQNDMNTVVRKYLGNNFSQMTKIESGELCCFNYFHESNRQLISGLHNILTNWRLNHFNEDDLFLLQLYFYAMFMRVVLLKNYQQIIRQKAPNFEEIFRTCGCPISLSLSPDLILMSVRNNIIYRGKKDQLKIIIELYRTILGLKAKKPKNQSGESKTNDNEVVDDGDNPNYVYFLEDTKSRNIKIGSTKQLKTRYKQFKTGNPDIMFYKAIATKFHKKTEKEAQKHFKNHHYQGEWYKITKRMIDVFLQENDYKVIDMEQLRREILSKIQCFVNELNRNRATILRLINEKSNQIDDIQQRNKFTQFKQELESLWKNGDVLTKNHMKSIKKLIKSMKKLDTFTFDTSIKKVDDLLKEKLKYEADNKHFM